MAKITGPLLSTFATGSIKKTLTVKPMFSGNQFTMQIYKRSAGKRHQINIDNQNVFRNRMITSKKLRDFFGD